MRIITVPHQQLRRQTKPVTVVNRQLRRLLTDIQSTLVHSDIGVGLAAPQIGSESRIFALNLPNASNEKTFEYQYFINPLITKYDQKTALGAGPDGKPDLEGCLSVPRIYAPVIRPVSVDVEYQTLENGDLVDHHEHFEGFAARVFQHEYDHLDGRLFTDLALEQRQQLYYDNGDELEKITVGELFDLFGGEF